jgi:hypothetical protein
VAKWSYRKQSQNKTIQEVESLLSRQHVSALALGHLQVSTCVSEETIQCDYSNRLTFIQRDLVDMETITNCQAMLILTNHHATYIIRILYPKSIKVGVKYGQV